MVKRLRRNPLKVESRVRFSLGSPHEYLPATKITDLSVKDKEKRVFSYSKRFKINLAYDIR